MLNLNPAERERIEELGAERIKMRLPQIRNPKTIESLLWCLLDMSGELADLMYEKPKAIPDVRAKVNVWCHTWQKDLAIQNYEVSLQLDAKNQNAIDTLKKLDKTQ